VRHIFVFVIFATRILTGNMQTYRLAPEHKLEEYDVCF